MNTSKKKLTRKQVASYARENYDGAIGFLHYADYDYPAARCCILNNLNSGFILASQSIEKAFKALIYLESGEKIITNHDPFYLKEKLKKIKDYDLDKYDDILKKLSDHFKTRYHDEKTTYGTKFSSTEELKNIDSLWLELKDKLPIPDEIKYRTKFFCDICEPAEFNSNKFWLEKSNISLRIKIQSYKTRYNEIQKILYGGDK